jgi:hypothetical protein
MSWKFDLQQAENSHDLGGGKPPKSITACMPLTRAVKAACRSPIGISALSET